jgi:hypothetical protein
MQTWQPTLEEHGQMSLTQPLETSCSTSDVPFVDRRQSHGATQGTGERRQFGNSYHNLTPEGKQLAEAIDAYKLEHRRRYITTDELLGVLGRLGYKQG